MASKRKLLNSSKHRTRIKKLSQSQPLIQQFLKKSKKQNKKVPTSTTTNIVKKIAPYTSPYQNLSECPMCCKKLYGLTVSHRDLHVNMCLDLAFNAPTTNIKNTNNHNNFNTNNSNNSSSVIIPKYVKKSLNIQPLKLKRSKSSSSVMKNSNYWNRKNRNKNKLNRYYTPVVSNGVNSMTMSAKQTKQEYYDTYKRLDGSNIIIDGFVSATSFAPCNAIYFLTHFHSDHYKGLTNKFNVGLIYCSEITSRLIHSQLDVNSELIRPLPMYKKCLIVDSFPESYVTLLDANHCPGAVMFLFEMHFNDNIKYHLHIGDARCEFESNSVFYKNNYDILHEYYGKIDKLYLDTTYLETKMDLPRQSDAIQFIADKCKMYMDDFNNDLIILIGTYSIGKERVLKQVAEQCNKQIFVTSNKQKIFNAVYGEEINNIGIFTNDESKTNIYVVGMGEISFSTMWKYKKTDNTKVIGFRPTGWASGKHNRKDKKYVIYPMYENKTRNASVIYEVPYSEHSSFTELCKFVKDINPKQIIPTVNNRSLDKVEWQIQILNEYKDKVKCEYHLLCDDGDNSKQTTLENYNFYQSLKEVNMSHGV